MGSCAHFLVAPPRCIPAGCVMPGAAHIYIFRNTGLYNESGLCQEQHFSECEGLEAWDTEQKSLQWHREGSHSSTLHSR